MRPATAEDIANSDYGEFMEPGDDWHELTPFAIECRKLAAPSPAASENPPPAG